MKYHVTDSVTSEFVKYMLNCFFSVKLSFMNEMYQIAESFGADWNQAVSGLISDSRVADSDNAVILDQVLNGVASRMSILYLLLGDGGLEL